MNGLKVKRDPMGRWWERLGKGETGLVGNTHTGKAKKGSTAFNKLAVGNLSERNSSNPKILHERHGKVKGRAQSKIMLLKFELFVKGEAAIIRTIIG